MTKLTILISLILLFGPFPSTGRPGVKDENYNKKKEEMRKNYLPTFESGEESEVLLSKCGYFDSYIDEYLPFHLDHNDQMGFCKQYFGEVETKYN